MNTRNLPPLKEKINNGLRTPVTPMGAHDSYPTTQGPVTIEQPADVLTDAEAITVNADNPLVQFDIQRAALDMIKTYQSLKVDVEDPKTVKKVKAAKKEARDLRLKVQRRQKKLDDQLVKNRKDLKTDAGSITREIKETEDYLIAEIKKDTDHKAKLAEEARLAEVARVEKLDENMRILETHCESGLVKGLTAVQIQEKIDLLDGTQIPKEIFQEKYQAACDLLGHAIETATENLAARKNYEDEEKKRAEELAKLKKQQDINDQHSWFNTNFGWNSSLETMEESLELLENSTFADHLKETVEQQRIQAQDVLVGARARKAEADRLAEEKADREAKEKYAIAWDEAHGLHEAFKGWDEAHAMNDAFEVEDVADAVEESVDAQPGPKDAATPETTEDKLEHIQSVGRGKRVPPVQKCAGYPGGINRQPGNSRWYPNQAEPSANKPLPKAENLAIKDKEAKLSKLVAMMKADPLHLTLTNAAGESCVVLTAEDKGFKNILSTIATRLAAEITDVV